LTEHLGEIYALSTAFVWAVAVIFFKKGGDTVHPIALNLLKNLVAVTLFVPTAWLMGESLLHPASGQDYAIMLLGGVIGIALSDTLFFVSLNLLGASLMAIVDCMYSPFIILLSLLFLHETLEFYQVIGAVLIIAAVLAPVFEKRNSNVDRRRIIIGTLWGAAALATMAGSLVMIKPILNNSPIIWASFLRMSGGTLGLFVFLVFYPRRRAVLATLRGKGLKYGLIGSVIGSYLAMMLWLAGMKYTKASIAAALNQTSNIFIFLLAWIILKETITKERVVGIILGVVGAVLVTFGGTT
jgi:drug/metabolite transporter (DMT)-like permease